MQSAWNGTVFVYLGEDRSPAATRNLSDYFPVDSRILRQPKEKQIFGSLSFLDHDKELGVGLGDLLVQDSSGRVRFACRVESHQPVFDRIELSFEAVGVSEDGQVPSMTVDSACRTDDDPLRLTPIWLPMSRIYDSVPQARRLELPEIGGSTVRLRDLASVWPERWTLVRVRLYDTAGATPNLILSPHPSGDSFSFEWKKH